LKLINGSNCALNILNNCKEKPKNNEKYDIIFISVTEPVKDNPSQVLYTKEFLEIAKTKLKSGGYLVQSIGCTSFGYLQQYCQMVNTYKKVFPNVSPFHVGLPSFGVSWGFIVASLNSNIPNLDSYKKPPVKNKLRFYDKSTHLSLFALPQYLRDGIDQFQAISTDKNPIWVY